MTSTIQDCVYLGDDGETTTEVSSSNVPLYAFGVIALGIATLGSYFGAPLIYDNIHKGSKYYWAITFAVLIIITGLQISTSPTNAIPYIFLFLGFILIYTSSIFGISRVRGISITDLIEGQKKLNQFQPLASVVTFITYFICAILYWASKLDEKQMQIVYAIMAPAYFLGCAGGVIFITNLP